MFKFLFLSLSLLTAQQYAYAKDDITERNYDDVIFKNTRLSSNQTEYLTIPTELAHAYGSDSTTLHHLDKDLAELVRLRIGQIDQCNYCVILHTKQTETLGISPSKVASLSTWPQSNLFSGKEKAALKYAESLSTLQHNEIQADYDQLLTLKFTSPEIEELTNVVILMDVWSRIFMAQGKISEPPMN
ncbi:carboxymuconolactone decarboxylase family protein [Scandinavium sp. M-37]|uniref:carboxymuconolactone decarboxylase family protein n=1 Tax=Scandinavium sp. M-37 TaxID=3373077 RepID=UPI003744F178